MTLHRKMPSLHAKCFAAESQKAHERSISAAMLEILCAFRTALPQAVAAFADNRNATGPVPLETNSQSHRKKIWPVAKVIVERSLIYRICSPLKRNYSVLVYYSQVSCHTYK